MYYGLRLYSFKYINIDFKKIDPASFEYGKEIQRIIYEAALCVDVGDDNVDLLGVYESNSMVGGSNLYKVCYVVNGVKVEAAFTVARTKEVDQYNWVVAECLSSHEKVSYLRNFISSILTDFNRGIRTLIFKD